VVGIPAPKPATLLDASTPIRLLGEGPRFVSRGGDKLEHALEQFGVEVEGRRALDAGASTGGFTDCLLQRGAAAVVAVDVGYGQLDWRIASDPRVTVVDRTNLRHVDPADLGAPFDIVTADLSFISLTVVMPKIAELTTVGSDIVLLVKPQFELGKGQVPRGGVVRDPELHRRAIARVEEAARNSGLTAGGVVSSPVTGAKGNREYLLLVRHGRGPGLGAAIDRVVGS
jgi:23S rRNA (cytidine1920-2'-O)/16S rRNA (cytidine1409-2'-O)-methyltransferase